MTAYLKNSPFKLNCIRKWDKREIVLILTTYNTRNGKILEKFNQSIRPSYYLTQYLGKVEMRIHL